MDPHNPRYGEEGAIYGQIYYSAGASENQQTMKGKHMAEIKLSTSRMTPPEVIDTATKLAGMLAPEAPKLPPIPNMAGTVADLNAKLTAAIAANDAYEAAKASLPGLRSARDLAAQELKDEIGITAKAAAKESKGDPVMLQNGGFEIASATHVPSPVPNQLQNLALGEGKAPGSVEAGCNPDPNAVTYEWQTTTGDAMNGPYVTFKSTTAASVTITGLTSGQRVWVRVRAVGTKGEGPWSDPANKIVP